MAQWPGADSPIHPLTKGFARESLRGPALLTTEIECHGVGEVDAVEGSLTAKETNDARGCVDQGGGVSRIRGRG